MSEQILVTSQRVLFVPRANSDFDRKGHVASVYSLQGTDCRDGNVLKDLLIHSLQLAPVIWGYRNSSYWYLNKGRPTWWHLLYYVNLLLNMFRMLIHPSSGACDYLVRYCEWLYCADLRRVGVIQGVPGGKDLTSGECSLGQTIPI